MSDETAIASTDEKPAPPKKQTRKQRMEETTFSMNFWEDERIARKFIKESLLFIVQKSNDEGVKAHFSRLKDNGDGLAVMEVQFSQEVIENGKKSIVFSGDDYIRVTFDPNRKFPKSAKEGGEKKKAELPVMVKWRP